MFSTTRWDPPHRIDRRGASRTPASPQDRPPDLAHAVTGPDLGVHQDLTIDPGAGPGVRPYGGPAGSTVVEALVYREDSATVGAEHAAAREPQDHQDHGGPGDQPHEAPDQ